MVESHFRIDVADAACCGLINGPATCPSTRVFYTALCVNAACAADKTGYLLGSIEGRVAVHHVEDSVGNTKNFTFKCHRDNNDIYAVNDIKFHPVHGTFVTAGSDG